MNKVLLIGRLGQDPDVRYTPGGVAITRCSIATSHKWKDKQTGELQEQTEWHRCVFFGKTAEIAGEYLKKGHQVHVEGRIHYSEYEKDGIKRFSTDIQVERMEFLEKKPEGTGQSQPHSERRSSGQQTKSGPQPQSQGDFDDDDIPF